MSDRLILIGWFALGVGLQAFYLVRRDPKWWKIGLCVAVATIGMVPGKHEHLYQPINHIFWCLGMFCFSFALIFKEDILPIIGEQTLLSYSLIFWFIFLSHFYSGTDLQNIVLAITVVPTTVSAYVVFTRKRPNFSGKLLLYTWFLCIVISLGIFQFSSDKLAIFFSDDKISWLEPVDYVAAGMAFLYLAVNATYAFELIPIPGKTQTWKDRMKEWHELTNLMTERFDCQPPARVKTLFILIVQGVVLFLNSQYELISTGFLINLLILLPLALSFSASNSAKRALADAKQKMQAQNPSSHQS